MCGIVGAVAERNVIPVLMEGLRRLEYRGYDSAGVAAINGENHITRVRAVGKVQMLQDLLDESPLKGFRGIAHTRWATHGEPTERNAHPHVSANDVAIVHNGIIENHEPLRKELKAIGYQFDSDTDTEVVAHRIHHHMKTESDVFKAVIRTVRELDGAYALAVLCRQDPDCIVVARAGCPVVIGMGIGENFVASDVAALLPVTRQFIFLEEGDVACIRRDSVVIVDSAGKTIKRRVTESELSADAVQRGKYRHYMLKEIYEQPEAVASTMEERIANDRVLDGAFGYAATAVLENTRAVHIIACGTSYHAGMIARYWIEKYAQVPCTVEIASEYRYRTLVVPDDTLLVTISQSGETADTLAALRAAKNIGYLSTLAICNVPESSLVRESDLVLMTRAGPEIGVASTKAFTTQLAALGLLTLSLMQHRGVKPDKAARLARELIHVPAQIEDTLALNDEILALAEEFVEKNHALFLGRGTQFPVAMEGALKLKEISYIHAEAYPAGELKHGPLALVDSDMPVVAVAPNNKLVEKLKSNLEEVRARGGVLYVFADKAVEIEETDQIRVIRLPVHCTEFQAPTVFTIPLQLLAYHVAVLRGTDVDQPRNLAKSVTVE